MDKECRTNAATRYRTNHSQCTVKSFATILVQAVQDLGGPGGGLNSSAVRSDDDHSWRVGCLKGCSGAGRRNYTGALSKVIKVIRRDRLSGQNSGDAYD